MLALFLFFFFFDVNQKTSYRSHWLLFSPGTVWAFSSDKQRISWQPQLYTLDPALLRSALMSDTMREGGDDPEIFESFPHPVTCTASNLPTQVTHQLLRIFIQRFATLHIPPGMRTTCSKPARLDGNTILVSFPFLFLILTPYVHFFAKWQTDTLFRVTLNSKASICVRPEIDTHVKEGRKDKVEKRNLLPYNPPTTEWM